jgi:hypothetical protein
VASADDQLATGQDHAIATESSSRPAAVRSVRWHDEACPQAAPSRAASRVAILSMSAMRSCCHSCSGTRALADSSRDRSNSVSPLQWIWTGQNSKRQQSDRSGAQNLSAGKGVGREGGRPERERPEPLFAVLHDDGCQPTCATRCWASASAAVLACVGSVRTDAFWPSQSRVSKTISPSGNSSAS